MLMEVVVNITRQHIHRGKAGKTDLESGRPHTARIWRDMSFDLHITMHEKVSGQLRCGICLEKVLLAVLPDQQSSTDMDIEGTDDSELRNLHTFIQHMQQLYWNPLPLIPA